MPMSEMDSAPEQAEAPTTGPKKRRIGTVTLAIALIVLGLVVLNYFKPLVPLVRDYRAGRALAMAIDAKLAADYPDLQRSVDSTVATDGTVRVEAHVASQAEAGDVMHAIVAAMSEHPKPTVECRLAWPDHDADFVMTSDEPLGEFRNAMRSQGIDMSEIKLPPCDHDHHK
jgi:hypothetical protein